MLSDKKYITGIIGIGAFIIGGLLARETAIEGLELVDQKIDGIKNRAKSTSTEDLPPEL